MSGLQRAVEIVGSQSELARRIGGKTKQQHISLWLRTGLPAKHVMLVVLATEGKITAHALRPDLYPLGFHFPPDMLNGSRGPIA